MGGLMARNPLDSRNLGGRRRVLRARCRGRSCRHGAAILATFSEGAPPSEVVYTVSREPYAPYACLRRGYHGQCFHGLSSFQTGAAPDISRTPEPSGVGGWLVVLVIAFLFGIPLSV